MIDIVRVGGATIAVRDELADSVIAVCLRCRGFGVLWRSDCTPSYWTRRRVVCPTCAGKGLYRTHEEGINDLRTVHAPAG